MRRNLPLRETAKVSIILEQSDYDAIARTAGRHKTTAGKFIKQMVLQTFKEKYA